MECSICLDSLYSLSPIVCYEKRKTKSIFIKKNKVGNICKNRIVNLDCGEIEDPTIHMVEQEQSCREVLEAEKVPIEGYNLFSPRKNASLLARLPYSLSRRQCSQLASDLSIRKYDYKDSMKWGLLLSRFIS